MLVPRFLYPLLPYRSFVFPILVLSAIVVPCWVIFRLYRRRSSGRRVSFLREVLLLIFVVYLAALAAATLTPNRSSSTLAAGRGGIELRPNVASLTCSSASMPPGSTARGFCEHNLRGNIMLFFPLGVLIPLVWSHIRFRKGMLVAIALSVSIELVQYLSSGFGIYRAVDINDVLLNAVGAGLGLFLISLLRLRPRIGPVVRHA